MGEHGEQRRDLGRRTLRLPHNTESIIEFVEPALRGRPVYKPVRRHRKVEVPVKKPLGLRPGQHHAEGRVELGELQRRVAKSEYRAVVREGYGLVEALLDP